MTEVTSVDDSSYIRANRIIKEALRKIRILDIDISADELLYELNVAVGDMCSALSNSYISASNEGIILHGYTFDFADEYWTFDIIINKSRSTKRCTNIRVFKK